jgi:hypothetical protein
MKIEWDVFCKLSGIYGIMFFIFILIDIFIFLIIIPLGVIIGLWIYLEGLTLIVVLYNLFEK